MDLGLLKYRAFGPTEASIWDATYKAGGWRFLSDLLEAPRYATLIGFMEELHPAPSVLDVGCGVGLFRARIGDRRMERFLGIDPSEGAINAARSLEDKRTEFRVAATPDPTFGRFDIVVCSEMLYYITDLSSFLDATEEVLKPDGHLLCSIWQHPGVRALQRALDGRFALVTAVEIRSVVGPRKRWRVSCHKRAQRGVAGRL